MRPRLALVPGEPAGVGPELCVRLVQQPRTDCDLIAFADPDTLEAAASALGLPLRLLPAGANAHQPGDLPLLQVTNPMPALPGSPDPRNAGAVVAALHAGAQVAALADGAVSAPFRSDAGWHIVQRTGSRQRAGGGDDNVRAQMREAIGRRKLEEDYNRFLREMRGEAFVEFRDDAAAPAAGTAPAATPTTTPPAGG